MLPKESTMKIPALILILLSSLLLVSASPKRDLYQVMSSHPHDVKEFSPFIQTVTQKGRLWLVHADSGAPLQVMKHLRLTDGSDVKHYQVREKKNKSSFKPWILQLGQHIQAASIKSDVEMLSNFKTRMVGTPDNQRATLQIKEIFSGMGLQTTQICYRDGACSVIAEKAGDGSSEEVIMLMAHLDSVGKNFAGADDNASGVAVMLEVARVLKNHPTKKTIRFFATNGEESGLLGAEHYADALKRSGAIKKLSLVINMDMVGYNANGIVELETDKQYEGLAQWFATLASNYTSLKSKITLGAWGSDHVPFIKRGVPTLLTIEDWSTKTPCYHLECDKPATLNYNYAAEIAKLNLAAIVTNDAE